MYFPIDSSLRNHHFYVPSFMSRVVGIHFDELITTVTSQSCWRLCWCYSCAWWLSDTSWFYTTLSDTALDCLLFPPFELYICNFRYAFFVPLVVITDVRLKDDSGFLFTIVRIILEDESTAFLVSNHLSFLKVHPVHFGVFKVNL